MVSWDTYNLCLCSSEERTTATKGECVLKEGTLSLAIRCCCLLEPARQLILPKQEVWFELSILNPKGESSCEVTMFPTSSYHTSANSSGLRHRQLQKQPLQIMVDFALPGQKKSEVITINFIPAPHVIQSLGIKYELCRIWSSS